MNDARFADSRHRLDAATTTFADSAVADEPGPVRASPRWMGWRLRLLVAAALAGCLCIFGLMRHLADTPTIDAPLSSAKLKGKVGMAPPANPTTR